jgi:predicted metal-dependent phosphoesterase TrpH
MFADLHLHTHFSDGTYTPEKVVESCREHGLSIIALTDHDTMEGCARAAAACAAAGLEFIHGAELTAEQGGHEVHLLAYFVETTHPRLRREMAKFQAVRQDRIREMVARLNRLKIPLDAQSVFALANCSSPGRPHVARALVSAGHCRSLDEAFERYLKKHRPAWVPKFRMSAAHAIELVHQAGGLAVMAHPGLNRTDEVIAPMAEAGLDGLECFHSRHSTMQMEQYLALAEQLDLLVTGGSDCHGESKGRPLIGTIKLPSDYVTRMKARLGARAQPAPAADSAPA